MSKQKPATVRLGFEVGTGAPVDIPLRHMVVSGQTQEAGKTTTLEALVTRAQLPALAFPPCYDRKQADGGRQESRREKLREYFEAWLRPVVLRLAPARLSTIGRDALMLWLATGAPEFYSKWYPGQRHAEAARCTQGFLQKHKLSELKDFMEFTPLTYEVSVQMTVAAVQTMTREQVRWFAGYLSIELHHEDSLYRIDDGYLAMKRKADLADLAQRGGLETIAGLGVTELRQALLVPAVVEKIGVPADILAIYREPFEKRNNADELAADELDEDNEMICIECGCSQFDPCDTAAGPCSWVRKSWNHGGTPAGVCSAPECKPGLKRWDAGDRDPSPAALEHRKMMHEMGGGQLGQAEEEEAMTAIAENIQEAAPSKKRKAK